VCYTLEFFLLCTCELQAVIFLLEGMFLYDYICTTWLCLIFLFPTKMAVDAANVSFIQNGNLTSTSNISKTNASLYFKCRFVFFCFEVWILCIFHTILSRKISNFLN